MVCLMEYDSVKTKVQSIVDEISRRILHAEYNLGERLPSERDMANSFNVSRDTVRQAYNILEQTGLLKRVRGSGTHISTELRGHSEPITAVAFVFPDFCDKFGMKFILALEESLTKRGTMLVLKLSKNPRDDDNILLDLMQKGVNNFIIWPSGYTELSSVCYRLRALGANIVFFDRVLPEGYADFVGINNQDAVTVLLDHAKNRAIQDFTFLSLEEIVGDSTENRKLAFIEWCENNKFKYDVYQSLNKKMNQNCVKGMLKKHSGKKCRRAYVCVNDLTTLQLIDIEPSLEYIYSIDGLVAGNIPGIITLKQPLEEMANKAVELIFAQQELGNKWKARQVILKGELIESH